MNINEIDKFRNDFFDKLINESIKKKKETEQIQRNCFHIYNIMGLVNMNGYQERTCSKCNHCITKSIRVWNGSKNGNCIIS